VVSTKGSLVPRLPLIVRTASDVEMLRANTSAIRRLPSKGVQVAIPGLEPRQAQRLRERVVAYVGACGCAEGGTAALIGLLCVIGWIATEIGTRGFRWSDVGVAAAGVLLAVLLGGLGKVLGVTIARLRLERCCRQIVRIISKQEVTATFTGGNAA
jgi:hypothetical protein